jgi:hypothetical protein
MKVVDLEKSVNKVKENETAKATKVKKLNTLKGFM